MKYKFFLLVAVLLVAGCKERSYNSEVNAITSSYERRKLHSSLAKDETNKLLMCLALQDPNSSKKTVLFPKWTRLDTFAEKMKEVDTKFKINYRPKNINYCEKFKGTRKFFCKFNFWNKEKDKKESEAIARKEWEEEVNSRVQFTGYSTFFAILGDAENGAEDFETDEHLFTLMLITSKHFLNHPEESGSKDSCPTPR
ncbi:MAG: hypothetical protein RIR26_893 [Pseudomonadota bacterium]